MIYVIFSKITWENFMNILITGASGFVGTALSKRLLDEGHELSILTRNKGRIPALFKNSNVKVFEWSETSTLPPVEAITGINGVINLMGENIAAKRWSDQQKKILHSSRVEATINLTTLLDKFLTKPLDFFISASAVGIYPANRNEALNEDSTTGNNFLAQLCKDWEAAAHSLKKVNRIVIIRTAVVLESHGGALAKMLPPFQLGLGGPIGNGRHVMSWIHLDDLVSIYAKAATDSTFTGIYNACSPNPVDNSHFTKALGQALHRPAIFPIPTFMLKLMFGEMSSIILDSQKIISKRLKEQQFVFKYETIESAMNKIFKKA